MADWRNQVAERLASPDVVQRLEAARQLLPLSEREPDAAFEIISESLSREEDDAVLLALLRSAHNCCSLEDDLIAVLEQSRALQWDGLPWYIGVSLALLARLAIAQPVRVAQLLPMRLDMGHPNWAALLSEIHARAWWACGRAPDAGVVHRLTDLSGLTIDVTDEAFRPFASRGAAIAQFALNCLGGTPLLGVDQDIFCSFHSLSSYPALMLHLGELLQRCAAELAHREYHQVTLDRLIACVDEFCQAQVHPIMGPFMNMQFGCERQTVEVIEQLAAVSERPLEILRRLPHDWEALYAVRIYLDRGTADADAVSYAHELCSEKDNGGSAQGLHEKGECLAALATYEADPVAFYGDCRERSRRWIFDANNVSRVLTALTDAHPEQTIELLEMHLREPSDLASLYAWCSAGVKWQGALAGMCLSRCFEGTPLSVDVGCDLAHSMVAVCRSCRESTARTEWLSVYEAVRGLLDGERAELRVAIREGQSFSIAHALTADIIAGSAGGSQESLVEWLGTHYHAILETEAFSRTEEGTVASSFGKPPLTMVFPSVRLALLAASGDGSDIAGIWWSIRSHVDDVLSTHTSSLDPNVQGNQDARSRAREAFSDLLPTAWWDHRVANALASAHLLLGEPEEALGVLSHMDRITGLGPEAMSSVEYNRACAYARLEQWDEAERHLLTASELRKLDKHWLQQDPDFEGCRKAGWFKALLYEA
jgi:tetratricopeptide (TPR) repeat protein